jgi:putative transposase
VHLLTRTQQQVQRQRRDFHHTTALGLLRQYDVVSLEDLQVENMVRNRHLAKRISAAGWAAFRSILEAKAACTGRQVIAVSARRRTPARTVAGCYPMGAAAHSGSPQACRYAPMSVVCPSCGLVLDRDENAALTSRRAGQDRQAPTWAAGSSVA